MASTFMGLETSKRGLTVHQSALYTTGHNISNANTVGYSRQRVDMTATQGFPGVGMNSPKIPGYLGTGAEAGSITRVRDQFVDNQFRQETTKLGYWGTRSEGVSQLEDILKEPSTYGLNSSFDNFYKSLQDLSTNPENSASRQVAVEKGKHLADTFNFLNKQMAQVQTNIKDQINAETKNVNSILKQIASLNDQIANVEPNGYLPNDLYDERDNLVDKLTQYVPITITKEANKGNSKEIAEGHYNISLKLSDGTSVALVTRNQSATLTPQTSDGNGGDMNFDESNIYTAFTQFSVAMGTGGAGTPVTVSQLSKDSGIMRGLIDSYGYVEKDPNTGALSETKGLLPEKLADLDKLAKVFVEEFNNIHKSGYTLAKKDDTGNVTTASVKGGDFFTSKDGSAITAANIVVSDSIAKDFNLVAASSGANEDGNGKNGIAMSNLKSKVLSGLNNASVQTFYQGVIGDLGVKGEQATKMATSSATLQLAIANNRASISSVSLDEEMTNMITYQKAYNASARMITVMDEALDKIINGMGRVGL